MEPKLREYVEKLFSSAPKTKQATVQNLILQVFPVKLMLT